MCAKERVDILESREKLNSIVDTMGELVSQIVSDHKETHICEGYREFQKVTPGAYLDRAKERLARETYRVALVGPFKAGKSTFLSALLKQPGMLPAEDAECTFSVGVVASPGPGEQERVQVTYFSPEEALRNILDHTRYKGAGLFEWDDARRERLLQEFDEAEALALLRESADKGKSGERSEEAGELEEFVAAFNKYKDRLGKDHVDNIDNLKTYVRKEEGIGHLLLIKIVEIYRSNPVLQKEGFQIADTPGTDSMNEAARKITFDYLKQADAVVYLAEARGLSNNFEDTRKELSQYHNTIRDKMFIVANKADMYEVKTMRKEPNQKEAPIETLYGQIISPLRALKLNEKKFYFTAGRLSELMQKKDAGTLTDEERQQFEQLRESADNKLAVLDKRTLNPSLYDKLNTCLTDGGIKEFRTSLTDYLKYDIQFERMKEVFLDLSQAYKAVKAMLDPEEDRVKTLLDSLKNQSEEIQEFIDQATEAFASKIEDMIGILPKAVGASVDKVKTQLAQMTDRGIEKFNIGRVRRSLPVQAPLRIKTEVINVLKGELSDRFSSIFRDKIPPLIKSKLRGQIDESKIPEVLAHMAKDMKVNYGEKMRLVNEDFFKLIDQFTYMRAKEETWDLLDADMKPSGFEAQWSKEIEGQFREDLKKVFGDKLTGYAAKMGSVLGRHYVEILNRMIHDFEGMMEDVRSDVKKDPDRVTLPVSLLTGEEEDEEEKKGRMILDYYRKFRDLESEYAPMESVFQ